MPNLVTLNTVYEEDENEKDYSRKHQQYQMSVESSSL